MSDRPFGPYHRRLLFPAALDADRVDIECENGVMAVRVRRAKGASRHA